MYLFPKHPISYILHGTQIAAERRMMLTRKDGKAERTSLGVVGNLKLY